MRFLILWLYCFVSHFPVFSQLEFSDHNVEVIIDFEEFCGNGFVPVPDSSQLSSSDWLIEGFSDTYFIDGINDLGDFARGKTNGDVTTGGIYAISDSFYSGMLIQPSGTDFTPGSLHLEIKNSTEEAIDFIRLILRLSVINNENRSNSMYLSFNDGDSIYSLYYGISPGPATDSFILLVDSIYNLSPLNVLPDSSMFFTISGDDIGGSGSRDEVVIDHISVESVYPVDTCTIPLEIVSDVSVSNRTQNSMKMNFEIPGDASSVLVLMSSDSVPDSIPAHNSYFVMNDSIGNSIVVSPSSSGEVHIDSLEPGRKYFFHFVSIYDSFCLQGPKYGDTTISYSAAPLPAKPKSMEILCMTDSSVTLFFYLNKFSYEKLILVAREGGLQPHSVNSIYPDTQSWNTNYQYAPQFGSTLPKSKALFVGDSSSVTIAGLSKDSAYNFRFYTYANELYSKELSLSIKAGINEVKNVTALPGDKSVLLSWSNPLLQCFEQVLVIASRDTIDLFPDTLLLANDTFGSGTEVGDSNFIVYSGNGSQVRVQGLHNYLEYHFKIFIRIGDSWSDGVSLISVPAVTTKLLPGDILVVSINTNTPSDGSDEICFVTFKDLLPYTSLDFTDNGYEREFESRWGSTEGFIRFIKLKDTVPKYSIICIKDTGSGFEDFQLSVSGKVDPEWKITNLNGNSFLDLNSSDQLWILQNGVWERSVEPHHNRYSGRVLCGWTASSWFGQAGHETDYLNFGTRVSKIFPGTECFITNVYGLQYPDKVKYTGPTDTVSQRSWIERVNDVNNWTSFNSNSDFGSNASYNYIDSSIHFVSSDQITQNGVWVGYDDSNWFNCRNWQGLRIPDKETEVYVDSQAIKELVIGDNMLYPGAECKNIEISGKRVSLTSDSIFLLISGTCILKDEGRFVMDEKTVLKIGTMLLNLSIYPDSFDSKDGSLEFHPESEPAVAALRSVQPMKWHSLTVRGGNLEMHATSVESDFLVFDSGSIRIDSLSSLFIVNSSTQAIQGYPELKDSGSTAKTNFAEGFLSQFLLPDSDYVFPVGSKELFFNPITLEVEDSAFVSASFKTGDPGSISFNGLRDCDSGVVLIHYTDLTGLGYWEIEGDSVPFNIILHPSHYNTNTKPNLDENYRAIKSPKNFIGAQWPDTAAVTGDYCQVGSYYHAPGYGYSGFSVFSIGGGLEGPALPIQLYSFEVDYEESTNTAEIKWRTGVETECYQYEIRKMTEGENSFRFLDAVECISGEQNHYSLYDHNIASGIHYYKLNKINNEGKEEILGIRAVSIDRRKSVVYPSVFMKSFKIKFEDNIRSIHIFNLNGRLVKSQEANSGHSYGNGLSKGVYIVELIWKEGGSSWQKIIKL